MNALKNSKTNRCRIQALESTFDIVNRFTFQNKELSVSDIVSQTRLHKTTAKRLIANLTARGYLLQIKKTC